MENSPKYHDERMDTFEQQLDLIEQKMATARVLAEALDGRQDLAGVLIDQFVEISDDAEEFAVDAAVAGVQAQELSRRNAADRLRMHSHTLQRIIDQRTKHDRQE